MESLSIPQSSARPYRSLFAVSFVALFVEIMLIRWVGTEVRVFAYFQNLALIACFLGFGLGCYWCKRPHNIFLSLIAITIIVVLAMPPVAIGTLMETGSLVLSPDATLWGSMPWFLVKVSALRIAVFSLSVFMVSVLGVACFLLLLVMAMMPLGQRVGLYLDTAPHPIRAYTVNLLGSMAGIWAFAGFSFLSLPPTVWFTLAFLFFFLMEPASRQWLVKSAALLVVVLVLLQNFFTDTGKTHWSPYQKLSVVDLGSQNYRIDVNNVGYMTVANMSASFLGSNPGVARYYKDSSYDAPFRFVKNKERVLILGAGAGNDADAALRNGAGHVDAVEIDPVIYSLGSKLHPDRPYHSPNVQVFINDARAFLRDAHDPYDMVIFALLDSHTQFSDYSNMRIDNYVYTEEAIRSAQRLLKPEGVLVLKFEVRQPWTWMGQRFYAMLQSAFGRPPLAFYAAPVGPLASATIFMSSNGQGLSERATLDSGLVQFLAAHQPHFSMDQQGIPPPTTDDWPYIYHRAHSIPKPYITISLILLVLTLLLTRNALEPRKVSTWLFFFLGAGFLLLETQLITRLGLYFGTTWLVNGVAITAVLVVLVLANMVVTRRPPQNLLPYYACLLGTVLMLYVVPWKAIPFSSRMVGGLLGLGYALPLFFAGIIFAETFRAVNQKAHALGANIFGAVAGGLLQNISFISGIHALLLVSLVCYGGAVLCHRFHLHGSSFSE